MRRSVAGWILAPALGAAGGGAGAAPVMLVAMIGVLAAVAIPNFTRFQLRAKDGGARSALEALHRAELALHEKTGSFRELRVGEAPPTAAGLTWTEAELEAARELGWAAEGKGHHAYTVAVGATKGGKQAFAACAESDADGDGVYAAWVVWQPVADRKGNLLAPEVPCRFQPRLAREPVFSEGDTAGVPVRVSPDDVF